MSARRPPRGELRRHRRRLRSYQKRSSATSKVCACKRLQFRPQTGEQFLLPPVAFVPNPWSYGKNRPVLGMSSVCHCPSLIVNWTRLGDNVPAKRSDTGLRWHHEEIWRRISFPTVCYRTLCVVRPRHTLIPPGTFSTARDRGQGAARQVCSSGILLGALAPRQCSALGSLPSPAEFSTHRSLLTYSLTRSLARSPPPFRLAPHPALGRACQCSRRGAGIHVVRFSN